MLHSTQVPAMSEFAVLPQTWFGSPLDPVVWSDAQGVPVGAGVKQGVSGEGPQQAGSIRQRVVDVGTLEESSTTSSPPAPSHASAWQVPDKPPWSDAGSTPVPG